MSKGKFDLNIKKGIRNKIYLVIILVLLIYISILNTKFILPSIAVFFILMVLEVYTTRKEIDEIYSYVDDVAKNFNIVTKTTDRKSVV